jgi:hypothetical protein
MEDFVGTLSDHQKRVAIATCADSITPVFAI